MGGCFSQPEQTPAANAKSSPVPVISQQGAPTQIPTADKVQAASEKHVEDVKPAVSPAGVQLGVGQDKPQQVNTPAPASTAAPAEPSTNGNTHTPFQANENVVDVTQHPSNSGNPAQPETSARSDSMEASGITAKTGDPGPLSPPIMQSGTPRAPDLHHSNGSDHLEPVPTSSGSASTWDKAKLLFSLMRPEELLNDLHDLKYIGAGGYGKVFKAVWRSAPAAVKLVPSHTPELFKSSSYKEALLCKELCHPNIVQTYETRCAQLTEEFVNSIIAAAEAPLQPQKSGLTAQTGAGNASGTHSYGSQEFVSGDGFGLPSPVPDMIVKGKTLPEAAAKWKDILFTTGAKPGDFLTVIIMDFCDYGSLVRPIMKGMFRPFSASGNDREARVRYRALLRTAKEIAQGLEHLHFLKVVHGDLKPGNVLLKGSRADVRGFNAQVIDFGLSHMVNNSNPQKVSKAGGTLVYAAPEVFSGRVGKAADVYSLGIILWEMVTGSQPYKDMAEGQIVLGVQKGGLRPAWPDGQLPQLQELYQRCVAQDPDARPKAKEVVQFLTQIEMDLRSELKAAHKQQQQMHAAVQAQQVAAQHQMQQQLANAAAQMQARGAPAAAAASGGGAAPQAAYGQKSPTAQQPPVQQQAAEPQRA